MEELQLQCRQVLLMILLSIIKIFKFYILILSLRKKTDRGEIRQRKTVVVLAGTVGVSSSIARSTN